MRNMQICSPHLSPIAAAHLNCADSFSLLVRQMSFARYTLLTPPDEIAYEILTDVLYAALTFISQCHIIDSSQL